MLELFGSISGPGACRGMQKFVEILTLGILGFFVNLVLALLHSRLDSLLLVVEVFFHIYFTM